MAYQDSRSHLLAEFERIGRILEGYQVRRKPDQAAVSPDTARTSERDPAALSLGITHDAHSDASTYAEVIEAERKEGTDSSTTLRLGHLVDSFDLSRNHTDVLLLALLPTAYPEYQETFAELQNDLSATQPTIGLVADLFSETDAEYLTAMELVGPESPLRSHSLISIGDPEDTRVNRTERPLFVEERIESYLLGHDGIDPVLEPHLEQVPADTTLDELQLDADIETGLAELAGEEGPRRFYWYGPDGTRKRSGVEVISSTDEFLRADLPGVLERGLLERLRREARLLDSPLHLESVSAVVGEDPGEPTVDEIFASFEEFSRPLIITGSEEWTPERRETASVDAILEFPRPSFSVRQQFWQDHADQLPAEMEPTVLAGTFKLTQGDLETALATAQSLAGDDDIAPAHVYSGCSAQSAGNLADLAEQLEPSAGWDDILVPEATMRELRTVASHVTNKGQIYAEWAFEERYSRGTGVVAMFSGPSGTGKTMAAEILASETGMELYKIDLSSVVSKYIGETEENLEQIFTEAENSNAVLLFDEADAVFGDRADVSDATDRYANVEVNYLLQRIEAYDGVVLLTTNYESNIDSAFMRRIDHSVSFRRPQEETREELWQGIFPTETPVEDLDYEFLASFKLTGGDIRTIAQTAAILGAADDGRITMKHAVRGLQRELEKSGKMVNPQQFEPYREFLQD